MGTTGAAMLLIRPLLTRGPYGTAYDPARTVAQRPTVIRFSNEAPSISLVLLRFLLELFAAAFDILACTLDGVAAGNHHVRNRKHQRYQAFHCRSLS
jgi:hypothetical protein